MNEKYLSELSKKKIMRIVAWICIIIMVVLLVMTFVLGISGSEYFMAGLVLSIIVPVLFYVFLWFGSLLFSLSKGTHPEGAELDGAELYEDESEAAAEQTGDEDK